MKHASYRVLFLLLACCFFPLGEISAQISYGGKPFLTGNDHHLRSSSMHRITMPALNTDSLFRAEALNEDDWQRTHTFAHKFYTDIDIRKESEPLILDDGTRVWQVAVSSENALSINLLFTRYHLPEGAQLFLYSEDYNQVIGKFDHRNNSSLGLLPVRPVIGGSVIIEYAEPSFPEFEGEIVIGEVNHGYKDFFYELRSAREPDTDLVVKYLCMPDVLCEEEAKEEILARSTVLLIVDGLYACTGVMVNNTAQDGTPYMLTAAHCMNPTITFPKSPEYYIDKAGTIIAFFNYNRMVCGSTMKATEEMSLAITTPRVVEERKDIALLEFEEQPPAHYNVYYAGWDMQGLVNQWPYTNLHHPNAAVKKYGRFDGNIALTDYEPSPSVLERNSFWKISGWTVGSTYPGSSGSPLFNTGNQIIGTLTGGNSNCKQSAPDGNFDYFTALYREWNDLGFYLDPIGTGTRVTEGFDPHQDNPFSRIANADYNRGDVMITSDFQAYEFAEEFNLDTPSELHGVYVFIPKMPFIYTQGVEIMLYGGESSPETLLASASFIPQYYGYNNGDFAWENKNTDKVATESFVSFGKPVGVGEKFFVAYRVEPSQTNPFAIYNTGFASPSKKNTTWVKPEGQGWIEAVNHTPFGQKTALAIQPLIRYKGDVEIETPQVRPNDIPFRYDRSSRTITLISPITGKTEVIVYSTTGQVMEKISLAGQEESFVLKKQIPGTIGIVKVIGMNNTATSKIIY